MGIDIHFYGQWVSFHVGLVLMVLAVVVAYGLWKLWLIVLTAMRG